MAIPDSEKILLPLLRLIAERDELSLSDAVTTLADHFALSAVEREERQPNATQALFQNRVGCAVGPLYNAGLINRTRPSHYAVTQRGQKILTEKRSCLDFEYLRGLSNAAKPEAPVPLAATSQKANSAHCHIQKSIEQIETAHQALCRELVSDVLKEVKRSAPTFFEQLVVDLLVGMGYGGSERDAGKAVGGSGDGGIDGIIREDKLGLDVIYIQAKRSESSVGRPVLQKFVGALQGRRARKGVFITTSCFSADAREYVTTIEQRVVLIDGETLAKLMIDHNVGVSVRQTYEVKRIDSDYFNNEGI